MLPETDLPLDGEILPPDFINWMTVCDLHQTFEHLAKVYGRARALELWDEIAREHGDDRNQ